jgi:multiple sugar transport system ATP-binding protein
VTHDQVEAMTLGDRVVVMRDGRILQQGTPLEIYNRPRNRFVAGFIGAPAMNFLDVTLARVDGRLCIEAEGLRIRVPDEQAAILERQPARALTLGVRPEHLLIGDPRPENGTAFDATIEVTEQLGAELLVGVRVAGAIVIASRIDPWTQLEPHQTLRLSLDPRGLHFFDRESGEALR